MEINVRERYIILIKANLEDKKLKVSLENSENALKHPNNEDLLKLEILIKKYNLKLKI